MRAALIFVCLSASSLAAQDTTTVERSEWVVGGTIGVPGSGVDPEPQLLMVGLHGTEVQPGQLGADLAAGIMPRMVANRALAGGARAGWALPLAVADDVLVLPSAGASLIAGLGTGGADATPGVHVGTSALMVREASVGFRTGITWHWFGGTGAVWLLEVGLVGRRGTP